MQRKKPKVDSERKMKRKAESRKKRKGRLGKGRKTWERTEKKRHDTD